MNIYTWITQHWTEIGVAYLFIIKIMTAVQDAVDAEPAGLKPPFGKVIYYMQAVSGYLFVGNRVQSIGGTNAKVTVTSGNIDNLTVNK